MKDGHDYIRDITEMRSMMERSTKFLSLSGWAGIMAGVYALLGAYVAYGVLGFNPQELFYVPDLQVESTGTLGKVVLVALAILVLAIGTAIYFSGKRAVKRNEKLWNATSRRLAVTMAVPLLAGGLLSLILISKGLLGLLAPVTLVFYGLSLYSAGRFTYEEVKFMGLIQIGLGLAGAYFTGYGLVFWALGFGVVHIIYGVYLHFKYER